MTKAKGCTSSNPGQQKGHLAWWQLSLMGIGCTIGTGYFLGSSIGIMITGPSIILSFLLAAVGTYGVYHVLAEMTVHDPQKGSFCAYAHKAFGRWAGFSCGWNYWISNVLVMGSQLTALSILTRFWFANVPLWVFAAGYASLALLVVIAGSKGFDRIENIFAVIKVAAIVMFIVIATLALSGMFNGEVTHPGLPTTWHGFFPDGARGFWSSLIYAFYAFGGVEVIGIMALQLKKREDGPKAGKVMLSVLAGIYGISMLLVAVMVFHHEFNDKKSPFVIALSDYHLPFFPHIFNIAIIIAGFSTMAASLFGVTNLLCTMGEERDAPALFAKKVKKLRNLPIASLGLGTAGLVVSVLAALIMPGKIYEYITTAAGILLLYNWLFILFSSRKLLKKQRKHRWILWLSATLVVGSITGTLAEPESRPGFYISILLALLIGVAAFMMHRVWKKNTR
ncbi:amino acid permease [Fictibacillus macauensis ZFHKF-1]|uniref:Amino acid permease n=1 Tax=Fictibacillus macauensis ZFHKF-1 TaxID=1196324 RepID=I8UFR8_9BACL|nr:amino acid permease [Fictibacillus macauensis]EIT85663.1 amino acid permease [Fictibacillus macauensis ZFHKF-1]